MIEETAPAQALLLRVFPELEALVSPGCATLKDALGPLLHLAAPGDTLVIEDGRARVAPLDGVKPVPHVGLHWLLPLFSGDDLASRLREALATIRTDAWGFRCAGLLPIFVSSDARLHPACWGVLPSHDPPAAWRALTRDLVRELCPDRSLLWRAQEHAALAGVVTRDDVDTVERMRRALHESGRPRLIAVCGIDGAGKSAHVEALKLHCTTRGLVCTTHKLFRHGVFHETVTDLTRLCAGDRALHLWRLQRLVKAQDTLRCWHEEVLPRLPDVDVALFDRYVFTHHAEAAGRLHDDAHTRVLLASLPDPDHVVLLDVPVELALERIGERTARTVDENPVMLGRYRHALLDMADRRGWLVLDGRAPFAENTRAIREHLEASLRACAGRSVCDEEARAPSASPFAPDGEMSAMAMPGTAVPATEAPAMAMPVMRDVQLAPAIGRQRAGEGRRVVRLHVDPAVSDCANLVRGTPLLLPTSGELAARDQLLAASRQGLLPTEVAMHLHAWDIVQQVRTACERVRGHDAPEHGTPGDDAPFVIPFWPPALFAAAGVTWHAWPELERVLLARPGAPADRARAALLRVTFACAGPEDVERAAARVLSCELSSAGQASGAASLEQLSRLVLVSSPTAGVAPPAGGLPFAGVTAGGFLLRDGRVLLERRPPDARLAPGVWDSPGGKAHPDERPLETLRRELHEELGIEVTGARLVAILDEAVDLPADAAAGERAAGELAGGTWRHHHFEVTSWRGEVAAREGQALMWHGIQAAAALPDMHPLTAYAMAALLAPRTASPA